MVALLIRLGILKPSADLLESHAIFGWYSNSHLGSFDGLHLQRDFSGMISFNIQSEQVWQNQDSG